AQAVRVLAAHQDRAGLRVDVDTGHVGMCLELPAHALHVLRRTFLARHAHPHAARRVVLHARMRAAGTPGGPVGHAAYSDGVARRRAVIGGLLGGLFAAPFFSRSWRASATMSWVFSNASAPASCSRSAAVMPTATSRTAAGRRAPPKAAPS